MRKFCLHLSCLQGYAFSAPAKSGVGIGVPDMLSATYDAPASFLLSRLSHTQIMVGWAGASHEAPVSDNAGYANPVQFTTSEIGVSGGGIKFLLSETATMATTPIPSYPNLPAISAMEVHHA
ncbi:TPA: ash family protein [Escherichia coli]|nr:ash family protein [Escherichia coli]